MEEIRPARPADLKALLSIQERYPALPRWTAEHFLEEISSPRSHFAVLEKNGKISGYGVFHKVPPEAQILMVAVAPEAAGQGWGRALLARLIEEARALNFEKMTLEVSDKNRPAQRLYLSAGFLVVGRRPKFYNDNSDALLMDLNLT